MKAYHELKSLVDDMEKDMNKFYHKGNKCAAVRVRHTLLKVRNLAQELRMDVLRLTK